MEINGYNGMNEYAYNIYQTLKNNSNIHVVNDTVIDANSDETYQKLKDKVYDSKYRINSMRDKSLDERYKDNTDAHYYKEHQIGKKINEVSDKVFEEMKTDGFGIKSMDRAFGGGFASDNKNNHDISTALGTNFEGSTFSGKLKDLLVENGNVFLYAYATGATLEDINSEEFQLEAENFSKDVVELVKHSIKNPNTETEKIQSERNFYQTYFNPTMDNLKENSPSIIAALEFDSTEEILDFIEEKKEYYNTHQDQHSEIRLEYLNRMEDKLSKIDVFSMTQENKPSMKIFYDGKVENDRIVGTLYG
jgi:hypothetical protein